MVEVDANGSVGKNGWVVVCLNQQCRFVVVSVTDGVADSELVALCAPSFPCEYVLSRGVGENDASHAVQSGDGTNPRSSGARHTWGGAGGVRRRDTRW